VRPVTLPTPKPVAPPPEAAAPPAQGKTAQGPTPPAADAIRATLRTTLGCNSAVLSRDERTRCQEQLGRGAHDEAFLAQPLFGEKRAAYDQAGAAKLAARAELERPIARPGPPLPADYDGEPNVGGPVNGLIGPVVHKPSRRAARVLAPLRP
jgi:hypothetical protein